MERITRETTSCLGNGSHHQHGSRSLYLCKSTTVFCGMWFFSCHKKLLARHPISKLVSWQCCPKSYLHEIWSKGSKTSSMSTGVMDIFWTILFSLKEWVSPKRGCKFFCCEGRFINRSKCQMPAKHLGMFCLQTKMGRSKSKGSARDKARDRDKEAESSESKSADIKIKEMLRELHQLIKDVQVCSQCCPRFLGQARL